MPLQFFHSEVLPLEILPADVIGPILLHLQNLPIPKYLAATSSFPILTSRKSTTANLLMKFDTTSEGGIIEWNETEKVSILRTGNRLGTVTFTSSQPFSGGEDLSMSVKVTSMKSSQDQLRLLGGIVRDFKGNAGKRGVYLLNRSYFGTSIGFDSLTGAPGIYEAPLKGISEKELYVGDRTTVIKEGSAIRVSYESRVNKIRFFLDGERYGSKEGYSLEKSLVYYPAVSLTSFVKSASMSVEVTFSNSI